MQSHQQLLQVCLSRHNRVTIYKCYRCCIRQLYLENLSWELLLPRSKARVGISPFVKQELALEFKTTKTITRWHKEVLNLTCATKTLLSQFNEMEPLLWTTLQILGSPTKLLIFCLNLLQTDCDDLEKSHLVFDELPIQDLVSWSSLILGYALKCF